MTGYLDADCVFNTLFTKGVFTRKIWKLDRITANDYYVSFELVDSARIAGFTIYIRGTYHCIGITALNNQARRFGLSADDIIVQCAIS
jgi:hypothetical protein